MNNLELCNKIKEYVVSKQNWNNDESISALEKIMAHFNLEPSITIFYQRDKELNILKNFFDKNMTEKDKIWVLNQIIEDSFSDFICTLSPNFIETYNEADNAYKQGLCKICGCGFRRALEYLVYDYSLSKNPNKENEIKKKDLSHRIDEYLNFIPDIQDLANAARKLGNNYTHVIETINENYSLENLKAFIWLLACDITYYENPSDNNNELRIKAKEVIGKM